MNIIKYAKYRKKYNEWKKISDSMMDMVKHYSSIDDYEMAETYIDMQRIAFNKSIYYLTKCTDGDF